jgi:hypothetical protein
MLETKSPRLADTDAGAEVQTLLLIALDIFRIPSSDLQPLHVSNAPADSRVGVGNELEHQIKASLAAARAADADPNSLASRACFRPRRLTREGQR